MFLLCLSGALLWSPQHDKVSCKRREQDDWDKISHLALTVQLNILVVSQLLGEKEKEASKEIDIN